MVAVILFPSPRRYHRIMTQPLVVEQSRAIPVDEAFDGAFWMDVPTVFRRWYGPFPPIKGVTGDWGTVGAARTLKLVGGGSMRENLVRLDSPSAFAYELSDIKGALAPLVGAVQGEWTFEPAGTGTNVTWRRTVHPKSALFAPGLPVFGRFWRGYARQALEELSNRLVR
jgi:Polyketide cyclase / dehydrase and lipid transport